MPDRSQFLETILNLNFKTAYESKYISSIRLKANESKTVAVEVKPSVRTKAGDPVIITPIELKPKSLKI
jgi:uncharacterized membrane protein